MPSTLRRCRSDAPATTSPFPGRCRSGRRPFRQSFGTWFSAGPGTAFKRIVLLPTHGGNFEPLARALARLGPVEGVNVIGISDLGLLVQATLALGTEFGIPASEGGLHAGQWETSMLLAVRPELVHMERAVPGYTGDPEAGLKTFFEKGTDALTETGVIGDPRRASADHGRRYAERLVELATEYVAERS